MRADLLRLAAQFIEHAEAAPDIPQLTDHLDAVARELGFRYFALVHHVSLRRSAPRLIESSNYPAVWSEQFIGRNLFVNDPVLQASQRTLTAFEWDDVGRLLPLTGRHRAVLAKSRKEGMGEGMTIPANAPGEPTGSCSFATRIGRALPGRDRQLAAQLIGIHAFERARVLKGLRLAPDGAPRLSPREEDCVQLLVGGASDKKIARLLNLSPETTRGYIKTARAAFGVATRTALAVKALRFGLASFDQLDFD